MNRWQTALEVRDRLRALRWPGGAQEPVFGASGVHVAAGAPAEEILPGGFPFAMVFAGPGRADPDEPTLVEADFTVSIVQMQEGDPVGEQAIIGGPRRDGEIGTSRGRGILELVSVVQTALAALTGADGLPIVWSSSGAPQAAPLGGHAHLASASPYFTTLCTSFLDYPGPYEVHRLGDTVSWKPVSILSGFVEYVVVASSGPHPPEDPSEGTIIGRTTATTFSDPEVVAAALVSVFAGYSGTEGASIDFWSRMAIGSWDG